MTQIWNWISEFNGFTYNCYTIDDLWILDAAIPLKDRLLIELVRGAVLWQIWLERNNIIFKGSSPQSLKVLGSKIISLVLFWCKSNSDKSYFKLTLILPCDVKKLPDQVRKEGEGEEGEPLEEGLWLVMAEEDFMETVMARDGSSSHNPMCGQDSNEVEDEGWKLDFLPIFCQNCWSVLFCLNLVVCFVWCWSGIIKLCLIYCRVCDK